ncbi:MAG TPA: hypothetical protein PLX89_01070 [Verrucomicrobiota bacterium]|nr:hypothetical protein [Verrucomicrobiota bacterium]
MLPTTLERLRDILREAEFLSAQVALVSAGVFLPDEVRKRAFVRSVEIIGEAAKNVPEETRARFPDLEWQVACREHPACASYSS